MCVKTSQEESNWWAEPAIQRSVRDYPIILTSLPFVYELLKRQRKASVLRLKTYSMFDNFSHSELTACLLLVHRRKQTIAAEDFTIVPQMLRAIYGSLSENENSRY